MKPKHSKKDYEQITKLGVGKILEIATVAPKKKQFVEDKQSQYSDMIKIQEKKKKMKKIKQKELQDILAIPGSIDTNERALELYDQQPLKASELSKNDIKRLERLRKKATNTDDVPQQVRYEVN